jgi:hypothetical protein
MPTYLGLKGFDVDVVAFAQQAALPLIEVYSNS